MMLGVIPARGGSKGVPRKNLRCVGGVSLLRRAVRSAADSGAVDRVVVSTDDAEIRAEALAAGAEAPFLRPAALAADESPTVDVVAHAVDAWEAVSGERVDTIVLLEPTSPFRRATHVRDAVARFREGGCAAVVSVCPLERKPENIFVKAEPSRSLARYIRDPDAGFTTRQAMRHLCRLNSAVYVVGRETFFRTRSVAPAPLGYVEMTGLESINVDEELDLKLAELVAAEYGL